MSQVAVGALAFPLIGLTAEAPGLNSAANILLTTLSDEAQTRKGNGY